MISKLNKKIAFYIMNKKGFYTLEKFINKFSSNNIEYVVSSIDKDVKKDYFENIQQLCKKNKIKFFDKNDSFTKVEKKHIGYKFAIGWRWIIKNNSNLIVFHDSLLPKYRGFAPLVNSLVSNENSGGVTALFASSEYDKGDVVMQKSMKINYPIKINQAINQIKPLYYELVKDIYKLILNDNKIPRYKQNNNKAIYSIWLDEKDYFIDWQNWGAKKIKRFIDAVGYPYDNAKAYLDNKVIQFLDVEILDDVKIEDRKRHIGKVIFIKDGYPVVVCKKGLIGLLDIRDMDDRDLMINFRSRFE
ncbi:MAG: methionyl-tRNA formyltransferase [Epsilonproteobacteria bacterium]|nr:MAG: methionyl-tRNA formyltransferase [Campylobacterota bacterium]